MTDHPKFSAAARVARPDARPRARAAAWVGVDLDAETSARMEALSGLPGAESLDDLLGRLAASKADGVVVYDMPEDSLARLMEAPDETADLLNRWAEKTNDWLDACRRDRARVSLLGARSVWVDPARTARLFGAAAVSGPGPTGPVRRGAPAGLDPIARVIARLRLAEHVAAARVAAELEASSLVFDDPDGSGRRDGDLLDAAQARLAELKRRAEQGWLLQDARNRHLDEELGRVAAALNDTRGRLDAELASVQEAHGARDEAQRHLDGARGEISGLHEALADARARIHALESSTSWRLTRPIRRVGDALKSLRSAR